jgi:integrase
MLKISLLLGQRPGEGQCMRYQDIVDGWWCLPGEVIGKEGDAHHWPGTKNHQPHRVWLPKEVTAILPNVKKGHVFRGGPRARPDELMCESINPKLKIPNRVRPHDLRRTHGFDRDAPWFRQTCDEPRPKSPRGRNRRYLRPVSVCRREQNISSKPWRLSSATWR